jgi:hypothetical protein
MTKSPAWVLGMLPLVYDLAKQEKHLFSTTD